MNNEWLKSFDSLTTHYLKGTVRLIEMVFAFVHRIAWHLSADDREEQFRKQLQEEIGRILDKVKEEIDQATDKVNKGEVQMTIPEKYINQWGKECWKGVTCDTPLDATMFHTIISNEGSWDKEISQVLHTNLGSVTILDRRTGFGHRDTETGYRDVEGYFWLASGMCDVLYSGCKTIGEAIEWVKKNANICIAVPPYKPQKKEESDDNAI